MRFFELTRLLLAIISMLSILMVTETASAQKEDPDRKQKGFTDLSNSGKLISMVIEPAGNQLKIYLTGKKTAQIKMHEAVVEASYFVGGQQKTLVVQRQTDAKSRKSFYLIDKFDANMKDLKINVKAGDHKESFDLPDLK